MGSVARGTSLKTMDEWSVMDVAAGRRYYSGDLAECRQWLPRIQVNQNPYVNLELVYTPNTTVVPTKRINSQPTVKPVDDL